MAKRVEGMEDDIPVKQHSMPRAGMMLSRFGRARLLLGDVRDGDFGVRPLLDDLGGLHELKEKPA